jgi:ABC-type transporter Mla MlaB component
VPGFVAWGRIVILGRLNETERWVLGGQGQPDLSAVDLLARTALVARRLGGSLQLLDPTKELRELLDLVGLRREVGGEPEGREDAGVEE